MQILRLNPPIAMLAAAILFAGCDREPVAWEAARAAHTIRSYEQYLADNADGAHVAEANAAIMPLKAAAAWNEAKASNDAEAYADFVASFPDSDRAAEARVLARALELEEIRANLIMRTPPNSFMQSSPNGRLESFPSGTKLMVDLTSALDGEPVMAKLEAEYTKIEGDVAMFETADGQCLGVVLGPYGSDGTAKLCDGSARVLPDPDDPEAVLIFAWKFVDTVGY